MYFFDNYQHLGFHNPYYITSKIPFIIRNKFSEITNEFKGELKIDTASIISILNKNFILGDRTLIQGIHRTPWYAKPNKEYTNWIFSCPPKHNNRVISESEIAITMFEKICEEIKFYIGGKKKIGILLSGGMDSRIVAGAIDFLIKSNQVKDLNITGLTWGNDNSRDVVYAKEISNRLGWIWKHYRVDVQNLRNNIHETASHGCEYSPIHLHAIPQIRDDNDLDLILAGSYGDSVGRAEYSGKKVTTIPPINKSIKNISGLLNNNIYKLHVSEIFEDIKKYHKRFPVKESYMQNELDYQLHYMRRMLNPCMELLNEKSEFHQVFTHPNVFGYIWSIDPVKRNDLIYKHMMREFKTELSDIPWARTGIPYMDKKETPDCYTTRHHSYKEFIDNVLIEELTEIINSGVIKKNGIFDLKNVNHLIKLLTKCPIKNLYYSERILWLASFSIFIEQNDISCYDTKTNITNNSFLIKKLLLNTEYALKKIKSIAH